jgi:large subunit ribosomal protein L4
MMALSFDLREADGTVSGTVTLDEAIFGIQPNVPVLHQVVTAQLAAARAGTQSTKTRAEVSGGGKKPFKQKGTGRARQGSERAPHFTGGGVALGPKPRSYRQRTPRKMIQLALRSALSDRAAEGKVVVVNRWPWETPSTKDALAALAALGLTGKVLVVLARTEEEAYKSFRNLPGVQLLLAGELNAYDILCNDWIVFTAHTLPGGDITEGVVAGAAAEAPEVAEPEAEAEADAVASAEPELEPESVAEPDAGLEAVAEPTATGESDDDEETGDE